MILFRKNPLSFVTSTTVQWVFTGTVLAVLVIIAGLFALNHLRLQRPLARVVSQDARNQGVRVTAYYASYYKLSTVVFDVRGIAPPAGPAGVIRTLISFAHELQGHDIDEVVLAYRGKGKLKIDGDDFLSLGASVGTTTPRKLMWELAHDLRFLNGKQAIAHLPGNYAALLQKSLGEGRTDAAAEQLLGPMTQ